MFLELRKLKEYASGERQGPPPLSLLADAAETIEKTQARAHEPEAPMKFRWPRGRYNGSRIDGLEAKASIHLLWWRWRPVLKWNFGAPYFHWLCFSLWTQAHYDL